MISLMQPIYQQRLLCFYYLFAYLLSFNVNFIHL